MAIGSTISSVWLRDHHEGVRRDRQAKKPWHASPVFSIRRVRNTLAGGPPMLLSLACYLLLLNSPDPAFLAGLANDPTLDTSFRRDCVLQLCRRHIKKGVTEAQVERLLGKAGCCQQDAFGSIGSPVTIFSTWFYSSGVCVMFCNGIVTGVYESR
jgi:hypothetical protein